MTPITPTTDPVFALEGAYELGIIDGGVTITEAVGGTDEGDVYVFTVSEAGQYDFTLGGLTASADIGLIDSAGEIVGISESNGSQGDTVSVDLAEGQYFLAVLPTDTEATTYTVDITSDVALTAPSGNVIVPSVDPGNSFTTGFDLGSLGETVVVEESLATTEDDLIDVYEFSVDTAAEYTFAVDGLSGNADLYLIDSQDIGADGLPTDLIDVSASTGTEAEAITTELNAGTYYVAVLSEDGVPTTYSLSAGTGAASQTGVEIITPPSDPDFAFETAFDLGSLSGTFSVAESVGTVGVGEDPGDIYQFTVDAAGEYSITLDGLSDNAELGIFINEDTDGDGFPDLVEVSDNPGTDADAVVGELAPGTYYAAVVPAEDVSTDYVLTFSDGTTTTPDNTDDTTTSTDTGDTFDTATPIGEFSATAGGTISETIGGTDFADVFSFTVAGTEEFNASLTNLDANVELGLFNSAGEVVAASQNSGTADESLSATITAGEYFIGVVSFDGENTGYDLTIAGSGVSTPPPATPEPIATTVEDPTFV